jgi:predicted Rossmann fold nucleotide-binding protein DprA/Smf involved in DNA uptake
LAVKKLSPVAVTPESFGLPDVRFLQASGNLELLSIPKLGLICSSRCPGSIVLRTFDLIRDLRDRGTVIVGGFHSPMERECLRILLRGRQPIVICPARSIDGMRVPKEWAEAYEVGRILVVSAFAPQERRVIRALALRRNRLVCALSAKVLVPHASVGGATLRLCFDLIPEGKPVLTFADSANEELVRAGARAVLSAAECTSKKDRHIPHQVREKRYSTSPLPSPSPWEQLEDFFARSQCKK